MDVPVKAIGVTAGNHVKFENGDVVYVHRTTAREDRHGMVTWLVENALGTQWTESHMAHRVVMLTSDNTNA